MQGSAGEDAQHTAKAWAQQVGFSYLLGGKMGCPLQHPLPAAPRMAQIFATSAGHTHVRDGAFTRLVDGFETASILCS